MHFVAMFCLICKLVHWIKIQDKTQDFSPMWDLGFTTTSTTRQVPMLFFLPQKKILKLNKILKTAFLVYHFARQSAVGGSRNEKFIVWEMMALSALSHLDFGL